MEKTILSSSTLNFNYEVVPRKYLSDIGKVLVKCETKEKSKKLYSILKKHLFFCVFERTGDESYGKNFIAKVHQAHHNKGFCEYQITQVLKRIKIGKITESSSVEKCHSEITYWK